MLAEPRVGAGPASLFLPPAGHAQPSFVVHSLGIFATRERALLGMPLVLAAFLLEEPRRCYGGPMGSSGGLSGTSGGPSQGCPLPGWGGCRCSRPLSGQSCVPGSQASVYILLMGTGDAAWRQDLSLASARKLPATGVVVRGQWGQTGQATPTAGPGQQSSERHALPSRLVRKGPCWGCRECPGGARGRQPHSE